MSAAAGMWKPNVCRVRETVLCRHPCCFPPSNTERIVAAEASSSSLLGITAFWAHPVSPALFQHRLTGSAGSRKAPAGDVVLGRFISDFRCNGTLVWAPQPLTAISGQAGPPLASAIWPRLRTEGLAGTRTDYFATVGSCMEVWLLVSFLCVGMVAVSTCPLQPPPPTNNAWGGEGSSGALHLAKALQIASQREASHCETSNSTLWLRFYNPSGPSTSARPAVPARGRRWWRRCSSGWPRCTTASTRASP